MVLTVVPVSEATEEYRCYCVAAIAPHTHVPCKMRARCILKFISSRNETHGSNENVFSAEFGGFLKVPLYGPWKSTVSSPADKCLFLSCIYLGVKFTLHFCTRELQLFLI